MFRWRSCKEIQINYGTNFLRADAIDSIAPHKLGGPFSHIYLAVVRRPDDINMDFEDYVFDHYDEFVSGCMDNEKVTDR